VNKEVIEPGASFVILRLPLRLLFEMDGGMSGGGGAYVGTSQPNPWKGLDLAGHAPTTPSPFLLNKADPRLWCSLCSSSLSSMVFGKEVSKEITSFESCFFI
jgi:hypothetical protein